MTKKIIFMGTSIFCVPILKSLYQNGYNISVVFTQPPQKSHRGQKINKSPIQVISETLNINYRTPKTLNDNQEEYEFLKKLINDLFETMYVSNGIGLAAVQIGILKRILVIDVSTKDEKNQPIV